jgi:tetratricopeptide (TPR) repeat protein
MKSIALIAFLLVIMNTVSSGQPAQIPQDSPGETTRLDGLVKDCLNYAEELFFEGKFTEAGKYVDFSFFERFDAFSDKHKVALVSKLAKINNYKYRLHGKREKLQDILSSLLKIQANADNLKNKKLQAGYYESLASAYLETGKRDTAEKLYEKSLKLFSYLDDHYNAARIRAWLIMVKHQRFRSQKDDQALLRLIPAYKKEIDFCSKTGSHFAHSFNTRHLGYIYLEQSKDYNTALKYLGDSLAMRKKIGFKPYISPSCFSLGETLNKKGETEEAIKMYIRSIEAAEKIHFVRYMILSRLRLGDIFKERNQPDKAKDYYQKALKAAAVNGDLQAVDQALEKLKSLLE